jgi:RecQ family ATP-dependent DNA helicase
MERVLQRNLRNGTSAKPADAAAWKGKYVTLLYCTPEMLQTERFRMALLDLHKSRRLTAFAVDEAHCVSSWGHDFRPAYLKLDYVRQTFPDLPLMACTATATPQVLADIRKFLRLEDRPCHLGSFDRKNVFYKVRYRDVLETETVQGATGDMVDFIKRQHEKAHKNGTPCNGIVYVHKQRDTVELARVISSQTELRAEGYHGGMLDTDRTRIQEDWMSGQVPIAVATIAFGMGIDCPHVRYVIHWNVAKTVEGFYQESGR